MEDTGTEQNGGEVFQQKENGEEKDGLLSQDHEELNERVAHLEKKVRQQEDEIVCIKSAFADVLRRLGQVEAERAQNSLLPSKPYMRTPKKTSDRKSHLSPLDNVNVLPHRSSTPPSSRHTSTSHASSASPRSATPIKKWSSMSNSIETNGHLSHSNIKQPLWNDEELYMKMYLKGRALNLYAPSDISDFKVEEDVENIPTADKKLKLQWCYGYRGRDCRNNLYCLPTGEVIYFSAAVVVLHNINDHEQRHYTEHTDDVKCLAVHPDGMRIASGQVAGHDPKMGQPHVRIWDSVTLKTLHVIGLGFFNRAVCCVAFSKQDVGNYMVAVDDADDHVMSVWDLSKTKIKGPVTSAKSSGDPVTTAEFHPVEKNHIVCCGKSQISFWTLEGQTLEKKMGIFGKIEKPKFIICLAFNPENGDCMSGDSNGNICIWQKGTNRISNTIKGAHDGPVFSLCVTKDGKLLSGGKDGKIKEWENYQATGKEITVDEDYGAVRMVSEDKGMFYIGTIRNCILRGNFDMEVREVVEGHKDELWGLATHPKQNQFLTCGSDRHIYMWDALARRRIWFKEISDPAHCASFHPTEEVVAIGLETKKWIVLDLANHEVINSHTDGSEQIECIQYSPEGDHIAVGSRDNHIYIYEVSEDGRKYHKKGRCSGHSSYVTHVDWSSCGSYLMSNSGDYEALCWNVSNCKQNTNMSVMRDVKWATQNCTLAFNAVGIWPDGADGTDINNCCKSHDEKLIASADDFGKVNLYAYPSRQPKAVADAYPGHSSHVTNAQFLWDDSRLITTGGQDCTVLQWELC